jgi:PAS domain S-box-containing protein
MVTLGEILRWFVYTVRAFYDRIAAKLLRRDALLVGSERRFSALLESAPDAMVIVDWHGHITLVNAQTEKLFGYERAELIGQNFTELLPRRLRAAYRERQKAYMAEADANPTARAHELGDGGIEIQGQRKDGGEFPAEMGLSPLQTDGGLLVSYAIRDVTERKRIEAELLERAAALERSNADLEQFAYVASHDLQAPLRVVAGFVDLLRRRYGGQLDGDADSFIDHAVGGVERMQRLIDDLLTYSRVRLDVAEKLGPVDFNAAVGQVLSTLEGEIAESGAIVHVGELPIVRAEPSQISQLFQNLISNAIKFSDEAQPHVDVSAERENGSWRFAIRDNGIGIEPEHRERVFEMFQRLHTPDEFPGTGIGLAICKKIIDHHGGDIHADPAPEGGTIMSFTLPVEEEDE